MKILIGILFSLAASLGFAAEAYKWVDEKGVTNYGEKPPESRPARSVNTTPNGAIEGSGQLARKPESDSRIANAPRSEPLPPQYAGRPAPGQVAARGMDFDVFIRLQVGMTEGELLLRAGPPDHRDVDNIVDIQKSYYYLPTAANPYTTVVTLRGGRIANLERIKKF
jgi:hypothetical protein